MRIRHPKIASLPPGWAPFAGWSMIFSPFGVQVGADHPFTRIAQAFGDLADTWRRNLSLCALPPSTYHVTFCDLVNVGNVANAALDERAEWKRALDAPALLPPDLLWGILDRVGLASGADASDIEFEFDCLTAGRGSHLAVELKPRASPQWTELMAMRSRLESFLPAPSVARPYVPHITLGYFADPKLGMIAASAARSLNEIIGNAFHQRPLKLSTTDLYAFADMASYWRCNERVV